MSNTDPFYFETQTGQVYNAPPKAPSNFYRYRLAREHLPRVWSEVQRAKVGSGGLEYGEGFLKWLADQDLGGGQ